jgi:hypothetical protein
VLRNGVDVVDELRQPIDEPAVAAVGRLEELDDGLGPHVGRGHAPVHRRD